MPGVSAAAKDWLKNTFWENVVAPFLRYLFADIAIPVVVMILLIIYVLIRRKLIGKKLAHQVTPEEMAKQAEQVSLPAETAVQNQDSPTEVI